MTLLLLSLSLAGPPKEDREDQGPDAVDVVETAVDVADHALTEKPAAAVGEGADVVQETTAQKLARDAAARRASREAIDVLSGGAKGATVAGEGAVDGAAIAGIPTGLTDDAARAGLLADDLARGGLTVARGAEVAVAGGAMASAAKGGMLSSLLKGGVLAKGLKGLLAMLGLGAAGAAAAGKKEE